MTRVMTLTVQLILIAALAIVSAYCEISLFIDFSETDNPIDTFQMGTLAGSLVMAQHTLAQRAGSLFSRGHHVAAGVIAILVLVLLVISVSASAVFYEARYQASRSDDLQAGTEYTDKRELVENGKTTANLLKVLAEKEIDKGNTWQASQLLIKAAEVESKQDSRVENVNQVQAPVTSSAGIVAEVLDQYRWFAWITFGLIADLIPMLLLVLLTVYPEPLQSPLKQGSDTNPEPEPEPAPVNTTAEEPENAPQKPSKTLVGLIHTMGKMPSWQEVKSAGISYRKYKRERDELEQQGAVFDPGDGTGFQLSRPSDILQ